MLDTETKRRIATARDILVGKVPDPKSQVEQITIALIYKFMDDMDKESVDMGGVATFFSGEYAKYSWTKIFDPKVGGHEMLNLYGEAILKLNQNPSIPQLFRDIFKNAYLPYRDPETLKLFLKTINEFHYDHSEMLGDAFEYLLSVLGSQGDAGQFRTPRHIIDFIIQVLQPKKNETICDPACGTAGFLISSYKYILEQNTKKHKGDLLTPDDRKKLMKNFRGYDISPDMVRLSLVNMYLHGFTAPNIYEYDTLTSEDRWNEYFDIIMANPPFMSPKGGIKPHKKFTIQANRSELLFVDYIAEHIHPVTGRAGIIVPEGIIFQSANAYKALRKMLVDKKYLYAVVSLPAGIFQPYSGVKTSILFIDKNIAKKTDNILFVKIDNDGFDLGAQRRAIDKNDLTGALTILQKTKNLVEEGKNDYKNSFEEWIKNNTNPLIQKIIAQAVTKKKIGEKGDYNLSVDRYRVNENAKQSEFEMVRLGDVCKTSSGGTPLKSKLEYFENGNIPWLRSGEVAQGHVYNCELFITEKGLKNSSAKLFPINTVLVAMYGATAGQVGILKFEASTNQAVCGILPNEKILPEFLYLVLKSKKEYLISLSSGGAQPNISQGIINDLDIPVPPLSIQQQIVSKIESYQAIINGAKQVVENYKPQIDIDPDWEMVELGEVCDNFQYGSSLKSNDKGSIPCLRMGNIQNGEIDWNYLKYAPDDEDFEKYLLEENDVLFNRTNSPVHVGKTGIFKGKRKAVFAGYLIRICYNKNKLLGDYLNYCLNSKDAKDFCLRVKTDGINQSNINAKILSTFQIPLPQLSIQQQIVTRIEQEQQLVNANKELIKIYEQKIKEEIDKLWKKETKEYVMGEEMVSMVAEE
ncbi:MAG: N-6 DNA methylase [Ginsengibacter sp.]